MVREKVMIKNATGLSLKPTEYLYKVAQRFKSQTSFDYSGGSANAKSILSVLGSSVKCGDEITLVCSGPDEEEALSALKQAIEEGLGES